MRTMPSDTESSSTGADRALLTVGITVAVLMHLTVGFGMIAVFTSVQQPALDTEIPVVQVEDK